MSGPAAWRPRLVLMAPQNHIRVVLVKQTTIFNNELTIQALCNMNCLLAYLVRMFHSGPLRVSYIFFRCQCTCIP